MNWMPEVRRDGFQPGEVAEQQGVAFLSEPGFGGISGWGERVRAQGLGRKAFGRLGVFFAAAWENGTPAK